MPYFASVITLLVKDAKQHLDFLDDGSSPVHDVTESERFLFLAIIIQMGHGTFDDLKDCWSPTEQLFLPFCD
jgi:hypothetical protein